MNVSEQTLLEGSWYALDQAGRLLRSAASLFETGEQSTALVIALFGREELGRSRLLRECAREVRAGKSLDANEVRARCDDHVKKQEAAAFSVTLKPSKDSALDSALDRALSTLQNDPASEASKGASALVDSAASKKLKRQPSDRHEARCCALYVDLDITGGDWLRPEDFDVDEARNHIREAVKDYAMERENLTNPTLRATLEQHLPHISVREMWSARNMLRRSISLPLPIQPK